MPEMKPLKSRERISLWLWANATLVGWLLVAGVSLIIGLIVLIALPVGRSTETTGVVVGTLPLRAKGSGPIVYVKLADGRVHGLKLTPGNRCKVGDVVKVTKTPRRWGISHAVEPFGCNT
jgi:hypothetical protein